MTTKSIYRVFVQLSTAAVLFAAVACSSEPMPFDPAEEQGDAITVIAEVARQVNSRTYKDWGYVEEGIYRLTYQLAVNDTQYNVASVDFNKEGSSPGIGIVTVPENKSLQWRDIGGGSTPTFYLDNVDPAIAQAESTPTRIVLDPQNNPYRAAIFDDREGTNDLLWGSQMARRNTDNTINFSLHHNMSRLRVQVTVDRTNEKESGDLELDGATVEISSLNQTPLAYNRLDGSLELNLEDPNSYTTLKLVDPENDLDWKDSKQDETNENIETFYTEDFVLPPQGLLENERRPRLTITLQNGRVFSGILPHAMIIDDGNHPEPSYLYFLKEHILTIRTVITEEPPTLAFMPVWVVEWIDKGQFDIDAHQAGIYTAQEFYKLLEYYRDNNEYQLARYGNLNNQDDGTQKWLFQVFHYVELDYDLIAGKMTPNTGGRKGFDFAFNNYTVTVRKGSAEPKAVTEQQLYRIVTGTETW